MSYRVDRKRPVQLNVLYMSFSGLNGLTRNPQFIIYVVRVNTNLTRKIIFVTQIYLFCVVFESYHRVV